MPRLGAGRRESAVNSERSGEFVQGEFSSPVGNQKKGAPAKPKGFVGRD